MASLSCCRYFVVSLPFSHAVSSFSWGDVEKVLIKVKNKITASLLPSSSPSPLSVFHLIFVSVNILDFY